MHEVKVIVADIRTVAVHAEKIAGNIAQYYLKQYQSMNKKRESMQELTAGFLLREYLGIDDDSQITRTSHGKPMSASGSPCFNLSHSGDYVVLAIAEINIGIDIEAITELHWPSAKKLLSQSQCKKLEDTPEQERAAMFTMLWTQQEAKWKLLGLGIAAGLAQERMQEERIYMKNMRHFDYIIACAAKEQFTISLQCV